MASHASWTWFLVFPALVSAWGLSGCGHAAVSAGAEPLHMHLYCPSDAQSCDPQERLTHFTSWVKEALYRPHSTFSIWQVDRSGSRRFFVACIPDHWSTRAKKKKAEFIAKARAGAAGSHRELREPVECHASGQKTPGRTQLVISPAVSPLPSDVWQQVALGSAPVVLHSAVVCDRSASTAGAACMPGALLAAFDRWVTEGLLFPSATFSVEMVGGPLRDALQPIYHLQVPDLPVAERTAFVFGQRVALAQLFDGRSEQYASTIAEAISAAVTRLRERRGVYRLIVFSDMLQFTPGGFNFEKQVPPQREWLGWLKNKGLAVDLRDIPVLVCGIHTGQLGLNSQAYATRLRDLWQSAFASMGAEVKLFNSCEAAFASYTPGRNQS